MVTSELYKALFRTHFSVKNRDYDSGIIKKLLIRYSPFDHFRWGVYRVLAPATLWLLVRWAGSDKFCLFVAVEGPRMLGGVHSFDFASRGRLRGVISWRMFHIFFPDLFQNHLYNSRTFAHVLSLTHFRSRIIEIRFYEKEFVQCGMEWFASSYLCITLVKIRNAALQKKESLTSKYISKFQMWFIAKGWYEYKVEIEIKKELT
jgi:hypothetical protein